MTEEQARAIADEYLGGMEPLRVVAARHDVGIYRLWKWSDRRRRGKPCVGRQGPPKVPNRAHLRLARWRTTLAGVKRSGRNDRIPVSETLSAEYLRELTEGSECHYCGGALPSSGLGLDRKDSALGYEEGNLVACCKWCNDAKGHMLSYEEFLAAIAVRVARMGRGHAWDGWEQHWRRALTGRKRAVIHEHQ